jgi:hypothetical protein
MPKKSKPSQLQAVTDHLVSEAAVVVAEQHVSYRRDLCSDIEMEASAVTHLSDVLEHLLCNNNDNQYLSEAITINEAIRARIGKLSEIVDQGWHGTYKPAEVTE